jgi:hypothetical protein
MTSFFSIVSLLIHTLFTTFNKLLNIDFLAVPFSVNQKDGNHLVPSLESRVDEEESRN